MTGQQIYEHVFRMAFSYTVLLVTPKPMEEGLLEVGAAVLVQIGRRLFAATAAHCMTGQTCIVKEQSFYLPLDSPVKVANRGANDALDIGFLELEDDENLRALGRSFCALGQLALSDLPAGGPLHVIGYPIEAVSLQDRTVEIIKRGFMSQFQEKEGDYLLFPFPAKESWFHAVEEGFERATFHETPKGFSGGGLWGFNPIQDGELFVPAKQIKLAGIQSAWWPQRRLLRCVPILRWLQLIHAGYPDLRADIEAVFPVLSG
jgi:hypothetical protein